MHHLLILSALLTACDPDGGGFGPGGGEADTDVDTDTDTDPGCSQITLSYRAELVTIAGEPFGLSYATDAGRMASGTMTYDTCVPDTDTFDSPDDGEYDHVHPYQGGFSFGLEGEGTALDIEGSGRPLVGIRGLDWFDFEDGGFDVFHEVERYVLVNGDLDEEADIDFTIGGGEVDFVSDELPETFPMFGSSEDDFACVGGATYCVTFAIGESSFGDSFLMFLHELRQL
jgi:hypothetical protein